MKKTRTTETRERVLLVGVGVKRTPRVPGAEDPDQDRLSELEELARSAGADVAGKLFQTRETIDPATLVGRGKLQQIKIEAAMRNTPLVVFDSNLTPTQQRNIERATERRVIDRTQLILDIFARHARSREGQLQVELAQLNYLLPRLVGHGAELSRLGGGIGTRGPGEQKLETDRRRIRDRIRKIGEQISTVQRQRLLRRQARQAVPLGTVALVGYTNAGKSTLFNTLSRADVLVSAKMFATLDPTIRAIRLPSHRRVLLSDTVGFIRDLPPGLLAAFRATLEEVQEAALILEVSDVSNAHHREHDAEVEKILIDLGVADRPRLRVYNKIDRLSSQEAAALEKHSGTNGHLFVSALTGAGFEDLLARIDAAMPVDPLIHLQMSIPLSEGRTIALVHALGRVVHSEIRDSKMAIEAELPESVARRLHLLPSASATESSR